MWCSPRNESCHTEHTQRPTHASATHCNTLQHIAAHCHTLQHTATHCDSFVCYTLQHTIHKCMCCMVYLGLRDMTQWCIMTHSCVWHDTSTEGLDRHVLAFGLCGCCSGLQWVAVGCSGLQWVAVRCSVLQRVAVCCSVLQCVAVCCSALLQWSVESGADRHVLLPSLRECCSVLQCIAVYCSVLQCIAACLIHKHTLTHTHILTHTHTHELNSHGGGQKPEPCPTPWLSRVTLHQWRREVCSKAAESVLRICILRVWMIGVYMNKSGEFVYIYVYVYVYM